MKKIIMSAAMLLLYLAVPAQAFIGMAYADKGFNLQVGVISNSVQALGGYKITAISNSAEEGKVNASLFYTAIGKQLIISKKEYGNYIVTPLIGIASVQYKSIDYVIAPYYAIELSKDANAGRFFISGNYCKQAYYSVGIKILIGKL